MARKSPDEKIDPFWEWFDKYKPRNNHLDPNAADNGCLFETFGAEREFILEAMRQNPYQIWTLVEAEGHLYVTEGFHYVNRMGYYITEVPWKSGEQHSIRADL